RAGRGRHRRRLRPGPRRVVEPAQPGDRRSRLRDDSGARRAARARAGARPVAWRGPPVRQAFSRTRRGARRFAPPPAPPDHAPAPAPPPPPRPPSARRSGPHFPASMPPPVVPPALAPRGPAPPPSRISHDLLRRRLGFRGALFSDALEMRAVAGRRTPERSAVGALAAGCDMLLVCQSLDAAVRAMEGVERAVEGGRLDATALTRSLLPIHRLPRLPSR